MIPPQAVEAAAKAICPRAWDESALPFVAHGESVADGRARVQRLAMESARAALEAAAPYIRAQAWDEGYTLGYADCANKQESNRPNPYMLNNEGEK